ncbi:MAG TPA: hypothetical protein VOA87_18955 [Thermoanaerobaculia bacterium]|nr:hypothetical protein [Thermoanaerobaculia bacterium]
MAITIVNQTAGSLAYTIYGGGSGITPSGSGVIPSGSGVIPSGSGVIPSGSGWMPSGSGVIPSGSGWIYGSGVVPANGSGVAQVSGQTTYTVVFPGTSQPRYTVSGSGIVRVGAKTK